LKKFLVIFFLLFLILTIFITTGVKTNKNKLSGDKPVARLDGKVITKADLINYVEKISNKKYKDLLKTPEGVKKLAEYYIQRQLLLIYAKEVISREDKVFKSHFSKNDEDTGYLIALLKREVNDKVIITDDALSKYMRENKIRDKQIAKLKLMSIKKAELLNNLIEKVRRGHDIEYIIKN